MANDTREVTINEEQRLYTIPASGGGYSCLGFDVCQKRSDAIAEWLGVPKTGATPGTIHAYNAYQSFVEECRLRFARTGERCPVELTPQLVGLEGKRVEVVDCYGERRRFIVGRSTGWIPCHLEIVGRNSSGGPAVYGAPFQSVRVVGRGR